MAWGITWPPDAERAGGDRAGHRRRHQYRLAVDADRDLLFVGGDLDLPGGQHLQAGGLPTTEKPGGWSGPIALDAHPAEEAAIEPRAAAQASQVAGSVRIVGH